MEDLKQLAVKLAKIENIEDILFESKTFDSFCNWLLKNGYSNESSLLVKKLISEDGNLYNDCWRSFKIAVKSLHLIYVK